MDMQSTIIGAPVSRIEGPEKVTGRTHYTADIDLPGMLWGKILRSPHPHARIRRIDAAAAWRVPGVKAVVTGQDVPGHLMGKVLRDMPVLCWDRVRYIGDRVAAVAAETPEAAEQALSLIDVDYELLPAVFDPIEAMRPEATAATAVRPGRAEHPTAAAQTALTPSASGAASSWCLRLLHSTARSCPTAQQTTRATLTARSRPTPALSRPRPARASRPGRTVT
jgi:CO/xanthine dehydrogenase Mo-binding subunit